MIVTMFELYMEERPFGIAGCLEYMSGNFIFDRVYRIALLCASRTYWFKHHLLPVTAFYKAVFLVLAGLKSSSAH